MKMTKQLPALRQAGLTMLVLNSIIAAASDPLLDSWMTTGHGRYARVFATDADRLSGNATTTWSGQTLPAYAGVQQVAFTADWVYVKTSSLGFHTLGPWYNNAAHTAPFPNWPRNQLSTYRFPRTPTVAISKTLTGLGGLGTFVDGVTLFDGRDGQTWTGTAESPMGTGSWERDAWINEGVTFDPAQAHQENTGNYHYHANPLALRHLLGDHVTQDPTTRIYSESTAPVTRHSPILGWVRDGYPIYGPYGFSDPTNTAGPVRRMVSGYQLRNGALGTDNLAVTGRAAIPAWATRLGMAAQTGPAVSATYPLGRYMQDKAYMGDLINPATGKAFVLGVDFDLDEENGRFCVTPEFPGGTYAYFVAIEADGSPRFPYLLGRAFHGSPTGTASALTGSETFHFNGSTNLVEQSRIDAVAPGTDEVTLVWDSLEGGTYRVETSRDLKSWSTFSSLLPAATSASETRTNIAPANPKPDASFFRVTRTALAAYDSTGGGNTGGGGGGGGAGQPLTAVNPTVGDRGTTITVTFSLGGMTPPANIAPSSATLGTIVGTSIVRNGNNVSARFVLPANTVPGAVTASVIFPGPPGMGNVTFSLANGFTVR